MPDMDDVLREAAKSQSNQEPMSEDFKELPLRPWQDLDESRTTPIGDWRRRPEFDEVVEETDAAPWYSTLKGVVYAVPRDKRKIAGSSNLKCRNDDIPGVINSF